MVVGVGALQYLFEEGPQDDWFDSLGIRIAAFLCAVVVRRRSSSASSPRPRRSSTCGCSGTRRSRRRRVIAFVMFAMLMGSMFLLPVFWQESLHYTATLTGIVLMPRTLAMMALSPIVGRLYNQRAAGVHRRRSASSCSRSARTSSARHARRPRATEMVVPLVITGFAFACLFVPLTTAALSNTPRHQMADAAGLNSFVRQIGGSVGLTIFATLFTDFVVAATARCRRTSRSFGPRWSISWRGRRAG